MLFGAYRGGVINSLLFNFPSVRLYDIYLQGTGTPGERGEGLRL